MLMTLNLMASRMMMFMMPKLSSLNSIQFPFNPKEAEKILKRPIKNFDKEKKGEIFSPLKPLYNFSSDNKIFYFWGFLYF